MNDLSKSSTMGVGNIRLLLSSKTKVLFSLFFSLLAFSHLYTNYSLGGHGEVKESNENESLWLCLFDVIYVSKYGTRLVIV